MTAILFVEAVLTGQITLTSATKHCRWQRCYGNISYTYIHTYM